MTMPAPLPANEALRLDRLRELLVLDTAPEPLFDDLAEMAREICGTPTALISLIDSERQWFKANMGLPGATQTPRDVAFCAHAILDDAVMEVPDATQDPRFAANPLVTDGPGIRFYAGAPLTLPDGARVGTLCAIDVEARQLTPQQTLELERLARIAVKALLMRRDLIARTLSARSKYEQALAERENFVQLVTDSVPVRIAYIDRDRRYRFVNQALVDRFGLSREQILGQLRGDLLKRDPDAVVQRHVQAALDGEPQQFEYDEQIDGRLHRTEAQLFPDLDAQGQVRGVFAIGVDITARTEGEQLLLRQRAMLHSVAELLPAMVAVVGPDLHYRFVNQAFAHWHGRPPQEIVHRHPREVLGEERYELTRPYMERALAGEAVDFERDYADQASGKHLAFHYAPLRLEDGQLDGFVVVAQDITGHRREQQRLRGLSQRDALTGLLNRAGLQDWLALQRVQGLEAQIGLLCIDLDRFKPVNDQHGHPVGDALLRLVGERLRGLVRPTDAVVRMGGDEFAVVLAGVRDAGALNIVADKILGAAHAPFQVGALTLHIGASVGSALGLDPALGWEELLARADAMLYRAKGEGRGRAVSEHAPLR